MELVFGLEVKGVDPDNHFYALLAMLDLPSEGSLNSDKSVPKTGFLINILAVIFLKGHRATEEDVWESLNVLGVHAIFGEPGNSSPKIRAAQVPGVPPIAPQ